MTVLIFLGSNSADGSMDGTIKYKGQVSLIVMKGAGGGKQACSGGTG